MQQNMAPDAPGNLFNPGSLRSALAGAAGGLAGFLLGDLARTGDASSAAELIVGSAIWAAVVGASLGLVILAHDNWQSLRGRWNRDLLPGLPLFAGLSFLGGAAGQGSYMFVQNSLTRGIGWALTGVAVGAGVGLLRRDKIQAARGALGGGIGGFIGGFLFNSLAGISSAGNGALSRAVGLIIMGAMIALLMRVVQDALKSAWLLGISTGPYEGKEYPLNTARVTVGRSELNNIALYREAAMPDQLGAFVFHSDTWWWQGAPVTINGTFTPQAQLQPGDTIQLGGTQFRYQTRSVKMPAPIPGPGSLPQPGSALPAPPHPLSAPASPASPQTIPGSVAPGASSAVTGATWVLQSTTPGAGAIRLPAPPAQVRVGRAATNQVVLSDASVSSSHAMLEIGINTLTVTDLGSSNGTLVNGQRLKPHAPLTLHPHDQLTLGRQQYTVQQP